VVFVVVVVASVVDGGGSAAHVAATRAKTKKFWKAMLPGVNVMTIIFGDFRTFSAKNLKNN
jgi:hypothetical protein